MGKYGILAVVGIAVFLIGGCAEPPSPPVGAQFQTRQPTPPANEAVSDTPTELPGKAAAAFDLENAWVKTDSWVWESALSDGYRGMVCGGSWWLFAPSGYEIAKGHGRGGTMGSAMLCEQAHKRLTSSSK